MSPHNVVDKMNVTIEKCLPDLVARRHLANVLKAGQDSANVLKVSQNPANVLKASRDPANILKACALTSLCLVCCVS
jgi:hypothetical protein